MKQISAMCTYIQSADSTDDSGVKVTINWQLVYFLLIYPSLPGNWQQDDNLTYIAHAKNIIICTATVMPPSKLAACAHSTLPQAWAAALRSAHPVWQLEITSATAQLWEFIICKHTISLSNQWLSGTQVELQLWKGQLLPKQRSLDCGLIARMAACQVEAPAAL